jgi:hypothetical protein
MKRWLGRLAAICVLGLVGYYAWMHWHHVADVVASRSAPIVEQPPPMYAEAREAQQIVGVSGPLADYVLRQKPAQVETVQLVQSAQPIAHKAAASAQTGESPVGTSNALLHQTFAVAGIVNLPFEVPAHASNPQLRGTYRSFLTGNLKHAGGQAGDAGADVEFLVLNERQYDDFLNGRQGEAVFSVEDAHDQEVNAGLPPTFDEAAKYYLVFRNNSHAKRVVQADFRIDF